MFSFKNFTFYSVEIKGFSKINCAIIYNRYGKTEFKYTKNLFRINKTYKNEYTKKKAKLNDMGTKIIFIDQNDIWLIFKIIIII